MKEEQFVEKLRTWVKWIDDVEEGASGETELLNDLHGEMYNLIRLHELRKQEAKARQNG